MNIPSPSELAERIAAWIATTQEPGLRPAINATGVLLPGCPLAEEAILALTNVTRSYSDPKSNPAAEVEQLLIQRTGAEAALVTSNYASARLVALAALACGRDVLVARGQLVEFADGIRLDEAIAAAGAVVRAVGAANKTRPADYAAAIGEHTGVLLHVHADSLVPAGDEETTLADLATLARKHQTPLIDDLVIGGLADLSSSGLAAQPTASASLQGGADIVLLASEMLLGGPPGGIILGKRALVQKIRQHPIFAAVAADRLRLTVLGATLRLYQDSALAERSIPLLSLIATPADNLKNRADRLAPQLAAGGIVSVQVQSGEASLTTAALPGHKLPTWTLVLTPLRGSVTALAAALETGTPPVCGRIQGDRLVLDLRTVFPRQDTQLVAACDALAALPVKTAPAGPGPTDDDPPLPDPIQ